MEGREARREDMLAAAQVMDHWLGALYALYDGFGGGSRGMGPARREADESEGNQAYWI